MTPQSSLCWALKEIIKIKSRAIDFARAIICARGTEVCYMERNFLDKCREAQICESVLSHLSRGTEDDTVVVSFSASAMALAANSFSSHLYSIFNWGHKSKNPSTCQISSYNILAVQPGVARAFALRAWTLSLCSRSKSLDLLSFLASRSLNPEMNRRPYGEKLLMVELANSSME